MKPKRIGIVGCGAIGSAIAKAMSRDFTQAAKLTALYDIEADKAYKLAKVAGRKRGLVALSLKSLISKSDLVVECASAKVSAEVVKQAIKYRRDCLIMSVGGLLDSYEEIFKTAKKNSCSVYIPSGAIAGIDCLKAHKLAKIKRVLLTTRKAPNALAGSPYILKNKIDLYNIKTETVIFEGKASDAVLHFPQNINVSATLSLAGLGKEKTRVKIICSPCSKNIHEIEIESGAGKTFIRCENEPSPDNPKTSYLAVLSAIATLRQVFEAVKIGT